MQENPGIKGGANAIEGKDKNHAAAITESTDCAPIDLLPQSGPAEL
jgi:hypothetical protein